MMKTFRTRTLTALVFAIIVLGGMLWNDYSFYLLFLSIAILGLFEYFKLIKSIAPDFKKAGVFQRIITALLIPAGFLIASGSSFLISNQSPLFFGLQLLAFSITLLMITTALKKESHIAFKNLGYLLLGILYIGLPFSLLIALKWEFTPDGIPILPFAILFSLWINDSLAYITGSLIGKTPFSPKISPKKTWEGTLGGIILTLIAAGIYGVFDSYFPIGTWVAIAGVTAIIGTIGDLLESFLKRKAGVKDSGHLLPGHGGILDRFDSMILAIPFVWILMQII